MTDKFTIVAGSWNLQRVEQKRSCLFSWSDDRWADVRRIHDSHRFTELAARRAKTNVCSIGRTIHKPMSDEYTIDAGSRSSLHVERKREDMWRYDKCLGGQ